MAHIIAVSLGLSVAGIVSGATGIAFPLIAAPLFLLDYAPLQAIMITAVCSIAGQILSIRLLHESVAYEVRWRLLMTGLAGVPLGTAILVYADASTMRSIVGGLLIVSGAFAVVRIPPIAAAESQLVECAIGLLGGMCGGLVGSSSLIPAIWLSVRGVDRFRTRAILQPYIVLAQCISLVLLYRHGAFDESVKQAIGLYILPVLGGITIGVFIFRGMSCGAFAKAIALLTLASGLTMICRFSPL